MFISIFLWGKYNKKCNMTEIYFQLESLLDFICTFVMLLDLQLYGCIDYKSMSSMFYLDLVVLVKVLSCVVRVM